MIKRAFGRFGNSGFSYLPFKVVEGAVGMAELAIYTRLFGKAVFGEYSVANASVTLIAILAITWLRFVGTRYISEFKKNAEERARFLSTLFFSYAVSALAGGTVLAIILAAGGGGGVWLLSFLLYFFGFTINQLLVELLLYDDRRRQNLALVMLTAFGRPALSLALYFCGVSPILCIAFGRGVVDLLAALVAAGIFGVSGSVRVSNFDGRLAGSFIRYGFPLIFLTLTMYVLNISDRYVVDAYFGEASVGLYTANYSIASSIFTLLTLGLSKGFYPRLLGVWAAGKTGETVAILSRSISNYVFLALPAAVGLAFVSEDLSGALLGIEYADASSVVALTAAAMFFYGLSEYFNKGHELTKKTVNIVKNSSFVAVLNIVLNLVFVPLCGYIAAAYTTLFSFIVYSAVCYFFRNKTVRITFERRILLNTAGAVCVMVGVLLFILKFFNSGLLRLFVLCAAGAAVYGAAHIALGTLQFFQNRK